MLLDNTYGLLNLLELNLIILVVSLKQNLNFKIQMLAGNSLISFLNSRSEENLTLNNWALSISAGKIPLI